MEKKFLHKLIRKYKSKVSKFQVFSKYSFFKLIPIQHMKVITKTIKNFLISINLYKGVTDEERLNKILEEQKRNNFIQDIIYLRTYGDYKPNYNREPSYTDYKLTYKDKSISCSTRLSYVPTPNTSSIEDWKKSLHAEILAIHKKNLPRGKQLVLFLD